MKIAVIVPTYNGGEQLYRCLQAIASSRRRPDQVIVVDDGSTDGSAATARAFDFELVKLSDGPQGPSRARNCGVDQASNADVLVFVDADVLIQPDTLALIETHLLEAPDVAALFGSYDQNPAARDFVSLYKNLTHHHVHQVSRREASTFWAGCGAVHREVFNTVGGFDESYTRPSIEDIELGVRIRKAGYRILLCPDVQVKHLKQWTLKMLTCSDIRDRAIPWTLLLLREGELPNDLNLTVKHRITAATVVIMVLSAAMAWWSPKSAAMLIASTMAVFIALNFEMLRLFLQQGGALFALIGAGLHVLYYLYSTAAFVWVVCHKVAFRVWRELTRQLKSTS